MNAADLDIVARTVAGEARGEPWPGKIAVACVIRNRVEKDLHGDDKPDWWGEGYRAVCLKPWQFSCWNEGDPNKAWIETVRPDTDDRFRDCIAAAALVMFGGEPDPTHGATHYHHRDIRPGWSATRFPCAKIGRHWFYNDVEK